MAQLLRPMIDCLREAQTTADKEPIVDDLHRLSDLLARRNAIDSDIARLINRPAEKGRIGEYVAAKVFDIMLHTSASHQGTDGHFVRGPLSGQSVNVKYYAKREGILDINAVAVPDFYLVLAGPKTLAMSSVGTSRPWVIESVFLFHGQELIGSLQARGVKVGIATSVTSELWNAAEIYPVPRAALLTLSDEQRALLALFT